VGQTNHQTSDVFRTAPAPLRPDEFPVDSSALARGGWLLIRPIGSDDVDRLAALFDRLSPESRYRRFLAPKPRLSPRELQWLTDLDHVGHDAVAAVDKRDGSIAGVARYARDPSRPGAAHIAVAVADELQGRGIGTLLAPVAVERARRNGYALLVATTLWNNRPARALLRRLGFRACGIDGGLVELELVL
jgi:RimJ/RimL family protein N-acetyltransferase